MNKMRLKRIFKYFFYGVLGISGILVLCVVFLATVIFCPYDFEMNRENKALYEYSLHNVEVEENITAYKKVSTMLYVQGECGFWMINLKTKEFKLLSMQLSSVDLNQDDSKNNKRIVGRVKQIRERYGERLTILESLDQLSSKEQKIYDELNNSQSEEVVYTKEHLRSEYYGPYRQPLEYLFN